MHTSLSWKEKDTHGTPYEGPGDVVKPGDFDLDSISKVRVRKRSHQFFKLTYDNFFTYGGDLAQTNLLTMFVMEDGYAVDEIGINTANVLQGVENAQN